MINAHGYVPYAIRLPLFLLVITATVLLGLLVSLTSMISAEHRQDYFPLPYKLILVLYVFLENFGFHQLMSLQRASAAGGQWSARALGHSLP